MKRVHVFRHSPSEGLGTIQHFLDRCGVRVESCDLFAKGAPSQSSLDYDFVISMGGPMNADETERYPFLAEEREYLRRAIGKGIPVLGICLGAQLIARALDARVYAGSEKEIGWYEIKWAKRGAEDPLFAGMNGKKTVVFQWHGDTFDLPAEAVCLASSERYPNQAFRYGERVYALQFHIEVTEAMILDWLKANTGGINQLNRTISVEEIKNGIPRYLEGLNELSAAVYPKLFEPLKA